MSRAERVLLSLASGAGLAFLVAGCKPQSAVHCVLAPPGPSDLGPASGLSTPPSNAAVFDLQYLAQTGADTDFAYRSFWGFGGSTSAADLNPFLREVRQKTSNLYYVRNLSLTNREWAAVEYTGQQAQALYFDVNGDGKLGDNERILPTRAPGTAVQFITPDFAHSLGEGGETLSRVLLQVQFYGGPEPSCMWSPASLLQGSGELGGQKVRLLLFANRPGGAFDTYGRSSYALLDPQQKASPNDYTPRETLSSLVVHDGQFYRLSLEGRRTNGLPARVVLVKDTSPTGQLAVKLAGSNPGKATLRSAYLHGVEDKTVFFRASSTNDTVVLPAGSYGVGSGSVSYGGSNADAWEVSFQGSACATVKAGETAEVVLGNPTLAVRAVEERKRYERDQSGQSTFKKGTPVYLEPRILGKSQETFTRFRRPGADQDQPPKVTITSAEGKVLLSKVMEYG